MEVWKLGLALCFIRTNIYFGLFAMLVSTEVASCFITVLPTCKPGLFKFFKASFPVGKLQATFQRQTAGKTQSWEDRRAKGDWRPEGGQRQERATLGPKMMGNGGKNRTKAGTWGTFSGTSHGRGSHYLVKGRVAKFRFQGWYICGGIPTSTYFETHLPQTSPEIRDWVPLRKLKGKKIYYYLLYNNVNINTKTGRTPTTPFG